ncbi:hypothetical protein B0E43_22555, partial [Algoriphagus sp. A40]
MVVFVFVGFVSPSNAQNANVKTFNKRVGTPQPPEGVFNVRGDFAIIGNTNLTLQNYTTTGSNTNNPMIYVDLDGVDETLNSSKSTLVFSQENGADPNCSNILYAGLYWSGKSRIGDSYTFSVENPDILESQPVSDVSQTATNGQAINYSNYTLEVERVEVSSSNRYPRYTLSGGGSTYEFEYTNAASNRVRYRINGGSWQTPANQTHNVSGGIKTATFDPVVITVGSMTYSVNRLRGNSSTNGNSSSYSNTNNDLRLTANGTFDSPVSQLLDKRKIKIKGPNALEYTEYSATDANILYPTSQYDDIYVGYRDITQYVKDQGLGEYTVADLALREGTDATSGLFGQWAIVVVYENSKLPWRDITIFDGYSHIRTPDNNGDEQSGIIPITGFQAAPTGAINVKLGIMAAEGDIAYDDFLQIEQGVNTDTWQSLAHPLTTTGNFLNSSIYTPVLDASNVLVDNPRTPNLVNNTGIDIAMWNIDNNGNSIIGNNQTSTRFKYGTNLDIYALYFFAFAVDAYVPDIEGLNQIQTINGIDVSGNPSPTVEPGQELTYKLDIRNRGTEAVTNGEIVVPMPYTASFVSSSVEINYSPTNSVAPVFDPTRGSTGSIVWNIGDIPTSDDPEDILATLTYTIKATEDCFVLAQASCDAFISVNGSVSGSGVTSNRDFQGVSFIQGYLEGDVCQGEPVRDPLVIPITGAAEWVAANCESEDIFLNFEFCNVAESGIPVNQIRGSFPVGTLFYNSSNPQTAVEYNDNNPFPRSGGTFYAIPPNSSSCTFTFNIEVSIVTTNPVIPAEENLTFCQGATVPNLNTLVLPTDEEYTVYFYTQATGGTATTTLVPSTAVAGIKEYWVAQGPSAQCIGPRVKITVTINALPDFTVINSEAECDAGTVDITVLHTDVEGASFTYWSDQGATQQLENPSAIGASGVYYIKATLGECTVIKPVTVGFVDAPNAGIDGQLTICEGSVVTEAMLFAALDNDPEPSGTWTQNGNVYTYTVEGGDSCPDDTAVVTVNFVPAPDAGTDGTLTVCEGTEITNELLFAALGGTPDTNGTWSNVGNVYTYTVAATAPCTEEATSTITVTIQEGPEAGTDGTLTVCEGTEITNELLFAALGGTPDTNGTWSNVGNVYTYTVAATAPCT